MKPEEAYSIRLISDVLIARKNLFHVETWIEEDKYKSSIFLNLKRITFQGNETMPKIYNDKLYFVRNLDNQSILLEDQPYGEPKTLLTLGKIHKFEFHKKGILLIGEDNADKNEPFKANKLKYRFDSRGLLRTRQSLYLFDGNSIRKIVSGDFDVIDLATNGDRVVIAATKEGDDYGLGDLYEVDLETSELKRITKGEGAVQAIAMNQEGKIAYLGHRKGLTPWAVLEIILPEEEKSFICGKSCGNKVLSDLFDGAKDKLIFEKNIITTLGQEGGTSHIYQIIDNKVEKITHGNIVVRGFDYKDDTLAYFYSTPEKPVILKYNEVEYDPNPNVKGFTPERIIINSNGLDIEGWAIIRNPEAPTILFIHGGPHMAYGYAYFIEFQFFANNGFNIIYSNPRGSQGYGEEFAKACVGDWGGKDMEDILNFVNAVKEKYKLKGKIGITGGSYGGFMTNWIITQTNIFSAAISERSISNLVSMCGTSDIGFWFNVIESGISDPWSREGIERLMKMSPIYYVKNVKTPTMLIHGEEDYRCPIEQAEQFFVALKMQGVPTMLVRYQGDSHEHARRGKPKNMIDRLKTKLEWFNKYLT
ncbi:S9 family peptidase [Saccharolobus caldissimus]|uniref:Acylaminoacyl-peptidase n=1 Tax=Saccharolobus caldissimus TaxID=1702097 RepID=A0AAQ4CU94_9CREN|nr:S9 family peptidase [Saccharolobus caldissimus]BDB99375.1 acylaminoacyl-peptidase [Saccharolobus caldissimus]